MAAHPRLRRLPILLLAVVIGFAGSWLGLILLSGRNVEMGPFRVRLTAVYGRGLTDIDLPPLGRITANTHRGPLRFTATLQEVSLPALTRELGREGPDGLVSEVQHDALASLGSYAAWAFGAAMLGAFALSLLVFRLRWKLIAVACVAALVATGGSELSVWATFRPSAFLAPRYSGSLALAPKLIGPVRTATGRIADFRAELEQVVDGAVRAYAAIPIASLANGAEIRVLHISDVHLNPLGLDFAREVAEGFDVNFVIDTGDLTSFGTPAEQLILSQIPAFRRPYLFVRGNHDSMALQEAVAKLPNAHVLDGTFYRIAGLNVYGLGDFAFTPNKTTALDDAEVARLDGVAAQRVLSDVTASPRPVDLVLVHDDRMAESVAGKVPLVLSGHFHRVSDRAEDGTMFLRIGSTGGTGATVFTRVGGVPLSVEGLYFTTSTPSPTLVAWDVIQQSPETGSLTVQRHLVSEEFPNLGASPSPGGGSTPSEPSPSLTP